MTRAIFDDFVAANGTVLNGRTTPSGHAMTVRYQGNDNTPTIQSNHYTSPVGQATYYYGTLDDGTPVSRVEMRFIMSGSGTNPLLAMLINDSDNNLLEEFIHFTLGPTAWTVSTLSGDLNGGTGVWEYRGTGITKDILVAGQEYTWVGWRIGNYVIVEIPGIADPIAYYSPRFGACAGDRCVFEIINYSTVAPGLHAEGTRVLGSPSGTGPRPPTPSYGDNTNIVPRAASVFDDDTHTWVAGANVAATYPQRSKLESSYGLGSLVVRSGAAGLTTVATPLTNLPSPGDDRWYSAHFEFKAGFTPLSTELVRLRLSYYNVDGSILLRTNFTSYTIPFEDEWRACALHLYALAGARTYKIEVEFGNASAAGRDLYVDKVALVEGLTGLWVPPA